jgi:tetratricopeptide (TPR) repeat protein
MKRNSKATLFISISSLFISVCFAYNLYVFQKNQSAIKNQENSEKISSSNDYLNEGINDAHNSDLDSAIVAYRQAIKLYSLNADAFHFLGYAEYVKYHNHGKKDQTLLTQALSDIQTSLNLNPRNPWALYNYSIVLWAANKPDEAIGEIEKLLAIDSTFKQKIQRDGQFRPFKKSEKFNRLIWS